MKRRFTKQGAATVGVAAAACAACCIGPIVGLAGAVVGAGSLLLPWPTVAALVVVFGVGLVVSRRRRRSRATSSSCGCPASPVGLRQEEPLPMSARD